MRPSLLARAACLCWIAGMTSAFAQSLPADLVQARADRRAAMIQGTYNNDTVIFFWQQTNAQGTQNFSETWVKDNGQWKCAQSHQSAPPQTAADGGGGGREGGRGRGGN